MGWFGGEVWGGVVEVVGSDGVEVVWCCWCRIAEWWCGVVMVVEVVMVVVVWWRWCGVQEWCCVEVVGIDGVKVYYSGDGGGGGVQEGY